MNKFDFYIKYSSQENKFYIKSKKDFSNIKVNIYDLESNLLYSKIISFIKGVNNWVYPGLLNRNVTGLKLLLGDDVEEIVRIKDKYLRPIKPISIWFERLLGLGDVMQTTPFIRKLYNAYQQKVNIFGHIEHEEFFKNNPYVNSYTNKFLVNFEEIQENFEIFTIFSQEGTSYWQSDLRQLAAMSAEISLKEYELELDFFPDEYEPIIELPENYILINPRIIGGDRAWSKEKWQYLINELNNLNIPVVTLGKNKIDCYQDLQIQNGVNLVDDYRQKNLSQTWHLINNSKIFVTFDTGMYILAGTTKTHILQIGGSYDPYFHSPVRNGLRDYKCTHVRGYCPLFSCRDNLTNNVKEHGSIRFLSPSECQNEVYFACVPTPQIVIPEILKIM